MASIQFARVTGSTVDEDLLALLVAEEELLYAEFEEQFANSRDVGVPSSLAPEGSSTSSTGR